MAEQWTIGKLGSALPASGTHRYFFGVYALDAPVDAATTQQVLDEIGKHTIGWGTLLGLVDH